MPATAMIQAVGGVAPPIALGPRARLLRHPEASLVTLASGAPGAAPSDDQAEHVFAAARALLCSNGSSLAHLARTWLWVHPIHELYPRLNQARTRAFLEAGLIRADRAPVHLPASTGIGLRPQEGCVGLEGVAAAFGPPPRTWPGAGNQACAFDYGSAFSRASRLRTPFGDTTYVSGTAAIDGAGHTVAPGDAAGQVGATVANIRAVLSDLGLEERDIVQGVAYAASEDAAARWRELAPGWPLAEVRADICRPELLFEIEVTVCPGAQIVCIGEHE